MCRKPVLFPDCVFPDVAAASRVCRHTVEHHQANIGGARGINTTINNINVGGTSIQAVVQRKVWQSVSNEDDPIPPCSHLLANRAANL